MLSGIPAPAAETSPPLVTRAAGANRVPSLPDYARSLDETGEAWEISEWESIDWLDAGLLSRARYEFRDQDYRTANLISEDVLYSQTLIFFGVREVIDPLRFAVEFEDARRHFSDRPDSANEANHTEVLQVYGELHFDDALNDEPVSLRFGRMIFDSGDRRLLSRNRYRNTINAFDGVRLRLGDDASPIEVDTFSFRPVSRSMSGSDESSDDAWLHGLTGYLREWSPALVLEPYWLFADQKTGTGKQLHTTGLHGYGVFGDSGWDYDTNLAGQWGDSGGRNHRAWAAHLEAGHTWARADWKPRLGAWLDYATGDRDPTDARSQRFDSLFGDSWAHYGYTSSFVWQNQIEPAMRLSFQPSAALRCEIFLRSAWLASERDAWPNGGRSDPTGSSGRHVGEELDLRATYRINRCLELEAVYSRFFPGDFVRGTGDAPDTLFGYVAATFRF